MKKKKTTTGGRTYTVDLCTASDVQAIADRLAKIAQRIRGAADAMKNDTGDAKVEIGNASNIEKALGFASGYIKAIHDAHDKWLQEHPKK